MCVCSYVPFYRLPAKSNKFAFALDLFVYLQGKITMANTTENTVGIVGEMHLPEYSALVERSVRGLPFSMANPLALSEKARSEGNYKEALAHLLDFFEMSVQWLNCYLLARLASMVKEADPQAMKALCRVVDTIDNKRPLSFGDSVNEIFHQLMAAATRMIPDDRLTRALGTHVAAARFNILAGSARQVGVVKIRNDFKGHSTALAQYLYGQVLDRLSGHLKAMLLGLEPLHAYSFHAIDTTGRRLDARSAGDSFEVVRQEEADAEPRHYYVTDDAGNVTDMYPLAMLSDNGYIFLFQTLKDECACYESSSQNVHRFDTESLNPRIDAFFQRIVPSFDVAREANWQEILDATAAHSRQYMVQVQKDKKYSAELFVERHALSHLLERFMRADGRTLLALPGEAGQGKTNQLCHWTAERLRQGLPVLIFSCADLADTGLAPRLREILHCGQRRSIERVLDMLHAKAAGADAYILFLFDALNECLTYMSEDGTHDPDGPTALFKDITRLLVRADRPRFKVVVTCRSFTWKNRITQEVETDPALTFRPDDDADDYNVGGFTADETREAYAIYGKLYQMGSDFEHIDRRILLRLRDPLTLKYACSNHVGKPFSDNPARFTSMSLFGSMMDDIDSRSFAGHLQCELLEELADRLLDSYLDGTPAGSIAAPALRAALADQSAPLHALASMIYTSGGVSVAYAELLRNPNRPILRESVKSVGGERMLCVEFIYERFLEYAMAVAFLRRARHGASAAAKAYTGVFDRVEPNVVLIGTLRNALLIDLIENGDYGPLMELAAMHSTRADVMQLVTETIDVLIRENYESELFELQRRLLDAGPDDTSLISRYNATQREIAADRATSAVIAKHNALAAQLAPVMRLRNVASVSLANMLLGDYFNENLYSTSPMQLLWRLVEDPISDVSNEACKQAYYLSRRRRTRGGAPLHENLTARIVRDMFGEVRAHTLASNIISGTRRRRMATFIETGARLATLLIIDACMASEPDDAMASEMLDNIRSIASYATARFTLVRVAMPFLQTVMRKQITFQSDYVNNAVEYQSFWDDSVIPPTAPAGVWSRERLVEAMGFVGHHVLCSRGDEAEAAERTRAFEAFRTCILSAYGTGCSFSYFILERIMVVMGTASWSNISPIIRTLLSPGRATSQWHDYSQMSLLYVLFQVQLHSAADNPEILEIYTREAADWTRRCRGLFSARNSAKANPTGKYKRNVMNWYGVVYCAHTGDGVPRAGDTRCAPLFHELIDEAIAASDKDLLFHLLDNIAEMICDCGLINLPLQLLRYILERFDSSDKLRPIDNAPSVNPAHKGQTLVTAVGRVLSAAHRFFPERTSRFLQADVAGLTFPGVAAYREEILGNMSDTEKLSDIFTHRFGNFLMWSLLNNEAVDRFATEAVTEAGRSRDCFAWYDKAVRTLCRHLFNLNV